MRALMAVIVLSSCVAVDPVAAQQIKNPVVGTVASGSASLANGGNSVLLTIAPNKLFLVRSVCVDLIQESGDTRPGIIFTGGGNLYNKFTSGCTVFEPGLVVARSTNPQEIRCTHTRTLTGAVGCAISGILVE